MHALRNKKFVAPVFRNSYACWWRACIFQRAKNAHLLNCKVLGHSGSFFHAHLSSASQSCVNLEIEDAKSKEGNETSDDQFRKVVVKEHIVKIHAEISGNNTNNSLVDPLRGIGQRVKP